MDSGFGHVLTSCGLPAVVSDVGDLGDLVRDGANGYLVPRRRPEVFAARILDLMEDRSKLEAFSRAALENAHGFSVSPAIRKWDWILVPDS